MTNTINSRIENNNQEIRISSVNQYFDFNEKIEEVLASLILTKKSDRTDIEISRIQNSNKDILNAMSNKILYYIDFFNNEALHKVFCQYTDWCDEKKRNYVVCRLNMFLEKITFFIKNHNNFQFEGNNSVLDILGNGPINSITMIGLYKDDKKELKKELDTFKENFFYLLPYIDILCHDPKKLELALLLKDGYIYMYRKYFFIEKDQNGNNFYNIPSGFKKLKFFYFFQEYEQGNIGYANLEKHLDEIKDDRIDLDKIRADFPDLKIEL